MKFQNRSTASDTLINIVTHYIWDNIPSIYHVKIGYESHIPSNVRQILRYIRTKTAHQIRYSPDTLIVDRQNPDNTYLLEYKCTQTPIFSQSLIRQITRQTNNPSFSWKDIGRCEREAFDNYLALHSIGVRVVILYYIAYHRRYLLCDFIENIREIYRNKAINPTQLGSGTPMTNFDANSMNTFSTFIQKTHNIQIDDSVFSAAHTELQNQLPIIHDPRSPYA